MPQIDTPLLLDILLGLIVLLFVPFGIRRGVAKEAMVSAGILLGATLAARFGQSWGDELSARFALDANTATFAASALLLLGCTFLLGYGGGAALGFTRHGTLSRLTGGLLAAFNAGLLLSYLLDWIETYLRPMATLDDGVVSEALLRRTDLLLLAAAGVLLVLTIIGWLVNAMRSRRQPHASEAALTSPAAPRQRPVRVSRSADADKYEPGPEAAAPSGRFGAGFDATSPLAAAPSGSHGGSWAADETMPHPVNGHGRDRYGDASSPFASGSSSSDKTIWSSWSAHGDETSGPRSDTTSQWPVASSVGVTDDERCAVCRARVGPRDVFCPECGATL